MAPQRAVLRRQQTSLSCRESADSQPLFLVIHLICFRTSTVDRHTLLFEMQSLSLPALLTSFAQSFTYTICMHMKLFFSFKNFIAVPLLRQCSEMTLAAQETCSDLPFANPDLE